MYPFLRRAHAHIHTYTRIQVAVERLPGSTATHWQDEQAATHHGRTGPPPSEQSDHTASQNNGSDDQDADRCSMNPDTDYVIGYLPGPGDTAGHGEWIAVASRDNQPQPGVVNYDHDHNQLSGNMDSEASSSRGGGGGAHGDNFEGTRDGESPPEDWVMCNTEDVAVAGDVEVCMVCMCVYTYVRVVCMCVYIRMCVLFACVCIYVCAYCMHVCVYIRMCVLYACVCVCVRTCI
jgi:hypothetical protein